VLKRLRASSAQKQFLYNTKSRASPAQEPQQGQIVNEQTQMPWEQSACHASANIWLTVKGKSGPRAFLYNTNQEQVQLKSPLTRANGEWTEKHGEKGVCLPNGCNPAAYTFNATHCREQVRPKSI
jgi:hypothetical protein